LDSLGWAHFTRGELNRSSMPFFDRTFYRTRTSL
jgi:hypothetical protein